MGPLAQLVEQLTLNQRAVGSTPTRPTIFDAIVRLGWFVIAAAFTPSAYPIIPPVVLC